MEPPEGGKGNFAKELYGENAQLANDDDHSLENVVGSFYGSSDEESGEAYMMNKESDKRREHFHSVGYRDGIIAGKEAAAQQGYNIGYKESVLTGYKFGIVRGVSSALAFLPDELRETLTNDLETREKFQKLHNSVHSLSTDVAKKLFYANLGEEGSTDLKRYVTELSSLLDKSPKIEVKLDP